MDNCLQAHNEYRKKHSAPSLAWDNEIANGAQKWAEHLASTGQLQHATSKDFGENLYSQWSSGDLDLTEACKKAVDKWYLEIQNYDFSKPGFHGNAGHFSQVIWKESKQLGVGAVKQKKNGGTEVIVVARYAPPGNNMRAFKENVLPPSTN